MNGIINKGLLERISERMIHMIRQEGCLNEESVKGNNHIGWPKVQYIQQLMKDRGCDSYVQMQRKADTIKAWQNPCNLSMDQNQTERDLHGRTYGILRLDHRVHRFERFCTRDSEPNTVGLYTFL